LKYLLILNNLKEIKFDYAAWWQNNRQQGVMPIQKLKDHLGEISVICTIFLFYALSKNSF